VLARTIAGAVRPSIWHNGAEDVQNETHPPAPRAIRTGRQLIFLGFGIAVLLAVAWTIRHALLVLYISAIFAVVLKPTVERVHRTSLFGWHPGRGAAVLLLAVAVILVLAVIAGFALPQLVSDLSSFFGDFPRRFRQVQHWSRSVPLLRNLDPESLSSRLPAFLGHLVPAVQSIGTALMDTLTVILLTAYLILDGKRLLEALLGMLPPAGRDRLAATLGRAGMTMVVATDVLKCSVCQREGEGVRDNELGGLSLVRVIGAFCLAVVAIAGWPTGFG
jgi:predicted PurR-regulated permease PerM